MAFFISLVTAGFFFSLLLGAVHWGWRSVEELF